jgi:hypothetical protein
VAVNALAFGPELPIVTTVPSNGPLLGATSSFMPEPAWIKVVLNDAQGQPFGRISGAEGQGSEIFFMEDGALGEMVLEMRPPDVVEILSHPLVDDVREAIQRRRIPGRLQMRDVSGEPLVPDLVALSPDLGLAILSFCGWMELGVEPWREELADLQLVAVASTVTVGVSARGHMAWVAVEGFARRQEVLSTVIEERPAVEVLNDLHRAYYAWPAVDDFERVAAAVRARIPEHLRGDTAFMTAFARVEHGYRVGLRERVGQA